MDEDSFSFFWFHRESEHGGNLDALPALYTQNSPWQIKKKSKINDPIYPNGGCLPTLITCLDTFTVVWGLCEQLLLVHVSTDPLRWHDRLYNLNFSCIKKKSQVKSRNDNIYTGFHMQLRSWKLKLQPKIMSYLIKTCHTPSHTRFQARSLSFFVSLKTHTNRHTHTQTHTNITSSADHTADGHLFPLLSLPFKLTVSGALMLGIFPFVHLNCMRSYVIIKRTDPMWMTVY